MTTKKTEEEWMAIIEEWKYSGKSQKDYCEERQLSWHTFTCWRTRLNRAKNEIKENELVKINPPSGLFSKDDNIHLILDYCKICIPANINQSNLTRLLTCIKEAHK